MGVLVPLVVVGSVAGAMICLGLAAVAWHYREVPAAMPFGVLVTSIAAWSLANAAFITSGGATGTYVADRIVRAVSIQIAPLWFLFVMAYVGYEQWISPRRIAALWAFPMGFVVLSVTAPLHGITSTPDQAVMLTAGGITAPYVPHDVTYLPHILFSFAVATVGLVVLIRFLVRSRSV